MRYDFPSAIPSLYPRKAGAIRNPAFCREDDCLRTRSSRRRRAFTYTILWMRIIPSEDGDTCWTVMSDLHERIVRGSLVF
jgi:hypothetical protein